MERRNKPRRFKNSAGNGDSGNGESGGSGDKPNRRPPGDSVAGAEKASSCRQQAVRGHAGSAGKRLEQLLARHGNLRSSMQHVAKAMVQLRNLKNDVLTLQDENVQLQMAVNRERGKAEALWNETEPRKRPPGMSPPRPGRPSLQHNERSQHGARRAPPAPLSFYTDDAIDVDVGCNALSSLQLIMPWNVNENDIPDFEDFQQDLLQYLYCGSPVTESYTDEYNALSSLFTIGETLEAPGTNPPVHAQPSQWRDEHRQCQEGWDTGQCEQGEQHRQPKTSRQQGRQQQQRQQRQQQQQFVLQTERSLLSCPHSRRPEQLSPGHCETTSENRDAKQEQKADQDHGSEGDNVTDAKQRRTKNSTKLEYEELPLD
ncbi:uncharacterized protein LOC142769388 [Rhipicephalus microplus]|uniref:uncharacterized protein LOC142769388 n=1 Tax=Rhipicephalus microplus TaxID=6941 RepID=UPI003F6CE37F